MFVQQIRSCRVARERSCPNDLFNEIIESVNITLNIASAIKKVLIVMCLIVLPCPLGLCNRWPDLMPLFL